MTLVIEALQPQVCLDADGVARVAGTRVTLDTVVTAFKQGATAEEIARQYDSLDLANVYAVIGFYLQQSEQVETYLRDGQQQAAAVRRAHEEIVASSKCAAKGPGQGTVIAAGGCCMIPE